MSFFNILIYSMLCIKQHTENRSCTAVVHNIMSESHCTSSSCTSPLTTLPFNSARFGVFGSNGIMTLTIHSSVKGRQLDLSILKVARAIFWLLRIDMRRQINRKATWDNTVNGKRKTFWKQNEHQHNDCFVQDVLSRYWMFICLAVDVDFPSIHKGDQRQRYAITSLLSAGWCKQ